MVEVRNFDPDSGDEFNHRDPSQGEAEVLSLVHVDRSFHRFLSKVRSEHEVNGFGGVHSNAQYKVPYAPEPRPGDELMSEASARVETFLRARYPVRLKSEELLYQPRAETFVLLGALYSANESSTRYFLPYLGPEFDREEESSQHPVAIEVTMKKYRNADRVRIRRMDTPPPEVYGDGGPPEQQEDFEIAPAIDFFEPDWRGDLHPDWDPMHPEEYFIIDRPDSLQEYSVDVQLLLSRAAWQEQLERAKSQEGFLFRNLVRDYSHVIEGIEHGNRARASQFGLPSYQFSWILRNKPLQDFEISLDQSRTTPSGELAVFSLRNARVGYEMKAVVRWNEKSGKMDIQTKGYNLLQAA